MALHYSNQAKQEAHQFLTDKVFSLRGSIPIETMLTFPSVDGFCAIAMRKAQGEKLTMIKKKNWLKSMPVFRDPKIKIWGIEKESGIVRRSTMIERGILQEFLAIPSEKLLEANPKCGKMTLCHDVKAIRSFDILEADIPKFDLIFFDYTRIVDAQLLDQTLKIAAKRSSKNSLTAVTSLTSDSAQFPDHAHLYHYKNQNSLITLAIWINQENDS